MAFFKRMLGKWDCAAPDGCINPVGEQRGGKEEKAWSKAQLDQSSAAATARAAGSLIGSTCQFEMGGD
jgi:hypothetical protein